MFAVKLVALFIQAGEAFFEFIEFGNFGHPLHLPRSPTSSASNSTALIFQPTNPPFKRHFGKTKSRRCRQSEFGA
jgi:hypothetical protein